MSRCAVSRRLSLSWNHAQNDRQLAAGDSSKTVICAYNLGRFRGPSCFRVCGVSGLGRVGMLGVGSVLRLHLTRFDGLFRGVLRLTGPKQVIGDLFVAVSSNTLKLQVNVPLN
jgi:hypothetical protein